MAAKTMVTQLAEMLVANGVDLDELTAAARDMRAEPDPKPRRKRQRKTRGFNNTVQTEATRRPEVADGKRRSNRARNVPAARKRNTGPKYTYGTAPVVKYANGQPKPVETHNERVTALEAVIPGIDSVAYVFSVGRDSNGKNTEDFALMQNNPWTWIELPGGKNCTIGKMDGPAVREALALAGYGWSPANKLWATDSNGNPSRRRMNYQAQGVGKAMLESE